MWVETTKDKKVIELIDDFDYYTIKSLIIDNFIKETDNFSPGYERVIKK